MPYGDIYLAKGINIPYTEGTVSAEAQGVQVVVPAKLLVDTGAAWPVLQAQRGTGDHRQKSGLGWEVALVGDRHQAIAESEREQGFGGARKQRDDPHRLQQTTAGRRRGHRYPARGRSRTPSSRRCGRGRRPA